MGIVFQSVTPTCNLNVSTWRYRQMIEHDGCPLPGYDQELWHKLGD
jgi:hypothetical protein